jgi:hypothetical protein
MKFTRRKDLSARGRLAMAVDAWLNRGVWGYMADLARRHGVSRQFVYLRLWALLELFEPEKPLAGRAKDGAAVELSADSLMLALRSQGSCSEGDISAIFKQLGVPGGSIGRISERLRSFAEAIPKAWPEIKRPVILLADETFSNGRPILVAMDARSHCVLKAVLADRRDGPIWTELIEELKGHGYEIILIVADQGSGIRNGAAGAEITHFPDLMHLLHPFLPFLPRFERKALAAIEEEQERRNVFDNAKSRRNLWNRLRQYERAVKEAEKAMSLHDDYAYLWRELVGAFDPFDADGGVRTAGHVAAEIKTVMDLMETRFGNEDLRQAVKKLRKALPDYMPYFERMEAIIGEFSKSMPADVLRELCLSWQARMMAGKAKGYARKRMFERKAADHMLLAGCGEVLNLPAAAERLFERLEDNVRSSSPLESVNSRIRDFLNSSRGQITQETLDLIVFFLNHNVSPRGRFKGSSAWQRLTGKPETGTYLDHLLGFLEEEPGGAKPPGDEKGGFGTTSKGFSVPFQVPCDLEKTG